MIRCHGIPQPPPPGTLLQGRSTEVHVDCPLAPLVLCHCVATVTAAACHSFCSLQYSHFTVGCVEGEPKDKGQGFTKHLLLLRLLLGLLSRKLLMLSEVHFQ